MLFFPWKLCWGYSFESGSMSYKIQEVATACGNVLRQRACGNVLGFMELKHYVHDFFQFSGQDWQEMKHSMCRKNVKTKCRWNFYFDSRNFWGATFLPHNCFICSFGVNHKHLWRQVCSYEQKKPLFPRFIIHAITRLFATY